MKSNMHQNVAAKDLTTDHMVVNPQSGLPRQIRRIETGAAQNMGVKYACDGSTLVVRIICEKGFSMTVPQDFPVRVSVQEQAPLLQAV